MAARLVQEALIPNLDIPSTLQQDPNLENSAPSLSRNRSLNLKKDLPESDPHQQRVDLVEIAKSMAFSVSNILASNNSAYSKPTVTTVTALANSMNGIAQCRPASGMLFLDERIYDIPSTIQTITPLCELEGSNSPSSFRKASEDWATVKGWRPSARRYNHQTPATDAASDTSSVSATGMRRFQKAEGLVIAKGTKKGYRKNSSTP
ncbi:hypothetical protein K469DRAFT_790253 [Zopfia rhizophila CBS 207.26]|uniref:Uncharacterized protein n=1 Tax=Zopfia rhizophila CBS 207.26 TaxID=1314779 RepID=A0A6A6DRN7_9PEZI|nr:hypothetical protein K469DRAFT_790253 [Zopfia rhizophila CBS 207.26]